MSEATLYLPTYRENSTLHKPLNLDVDPNAVKQGSKVGKNPLNNPRAGKHNPRQLGWDLPAIFCDGSSLEALKIFERDRL